ncbi:hypothetical protein KIW84_057484 [Lathyrus oleraceus]|uniref:Uncharacterized protein n=1 Tax=Pisum sativum TaxID=3888 RepID=A0A9D4X618_PEA|nr:hypothetical protein KIW84_057484 [Pisum sativum]
MLNWDIRFWLSKEGSRRMPILDSVMERLENNYRSVIGWKFGGWLMVVTSQFLVWRFFLSVTAVDDGAALWCSVVWPQRNQFLENVFVDPNSFGIGPDDKYKCEDPKFTEGITHV